MRERDFLFRESFYSTLQKLDPSNVRLAAYDLLCGAGTYHENGFPIAPDTKEALAPMLEPMFASIKLPRKKREPNLFLFRENFYQTALELTDPDIRLAYYELLCEFGLTGVNHIDSYPIAPEKQEALALILEHIFQSIEDTRQRYGRAVENGRKGGLKGGRLGGRGHKKQAVSASQTAQNNIGGFEK